MDAIRRLRGPERLAAYRRLEEDLVRGPAPFAAFGAFVGAEYMSNRIGCRLVQGAYNVIDLGALCLRRS
jgi:hypothetical protein